MPLLDALAPSSIASAEADADSAARCAMVCLRLMCPAEPTNDTTLRIRPLLYLHKEIATCCSFVGVRN